MHNHFDGPFMAADDSEDRSSGTGTSDSGDIADTDGTDTGPEPELADTKDRRVSSIEEDDSGDVIGDEGNEGPQLEDELGAVLNPPGDPDTLPGMVHDLGVDAALREEMFDNARNFGLDEQPINVNDERAFDDGLPGSWSDFSPVAAETSELENATPDGIAPRFANPNQDGGGHVKGPRVGGSGGIDGGPARTTPLPGTEES